MKLLQEMLGGGFSTTVARELRNKKGDVFPVGTKVSCEFKDRFVRVSDGNIAVNVPYTVASKYLTKFKAAPTMNTLEKMVYSGIATTPLGSKTEVDGTGIYGEPSWPLILGLV